MAIKNLDDLLKHVMSPAKKDAPDFHPEFSKNIGRVDQLNARAERHATFDGNDVKLTRGGISEEALEESVERLKDLKTELAGYETDVGKRAAQRGIDKVGRTLNKDFDKHVRELHRADTSAERVIAELEKEKTELVKDLERKYFKEVKGLETKIATAADDTLRQGLIEQREAIKTNLDTAKDALREHINELIEGKKEVQTHVRDLTKQLEEATGRSASEAIGKSAATEAKALSAESKALANGEKVAGKWGFGKIALTGLGSVLTLDGIRRMMGAESTGTDKAVGAGETALGATIVYKAVTAAKAASHAIR